MSSSLSLEFLDELVGELFILPLCTSFCVGVASSLGTATLVSFGRETAPAICIQ